MFCLRSWLPLLFIPTNASPLFLLMFFALTYFLNRPCIYCSLLLLILFLSSCHWSNACLLSFTTSSLFEPRQLSSAFPNPISGDGGTGIGSASSPSNFCDSSASTEAHGDVSTFIATTIKNTTAALAGAAIEEAKRRMGAGGSSAPEWTGLGIEWIRRLLGRREWRVPCVGVLVRL